MKQLRDSWQTVNTLADKAKENHTLIHEDTLKDSMKDFNLISDSGESAVRHLNCRGVIMNGDARFPLKNKEYTWPKQKL